ncbi:MAG TPA: triose-phosphate isomerase [bacterium]|nr:triose-phosphate isomerase [bacterium]
MRKPIIAGNWKMNKLTSEAVELAREVKNKTGTIADREIVLCPPFTVLSSVKEVIKGSSIKLGAQNMYWEVRGAYTGEVSPTMLKDIGCNYVILGHSERRQYFGETNETVNKKAKIAFSIGLIPIVCVGETLRQREKGETLTVIEEQVKTGLSGLTKEESKGLVVAYEPVWAIGTGKTATPEEAEEVQRFIRKLLGQMFGKENAQAIRILYGGSINPDNISVLMSCEDIDGGLIGGASLNVESFLKVVRY